jgi:predicted O-methyltransferase YrrM
MNALSRLRRRHPIDVARFGIRVAGVALRDPREAVDHVATQMALARSEAPTRRVSKDPEWRRRLHDVLGVRWPCDESASFEQVWQEAGEQLRSAPIAATPHDADPTLAEAAWCLVRHLRPQVVVETGVSRGFTTRTILAALEANGDGALWSVDLPPLEEPWRKLVGSAVPHRLRGRWTYVRGASRRQLAPVCRRVGTIDLFVHDSLHTPSNFAFEIATVWPHLRQGGAVVVDDADACGAADVLPHLTGVEAFAAPHTTKDDAVAFALKS